MRYAFSFFSGHADDLTGPSYDRGIMGGYGSPEQGSKWTLKGRRGGMGIFFTTKE